MATSDAMDDSFRVRVEKIFGSLTSSSSQQSSSLQSTLWSLTDDEVERREWRQGGAGTPDRDEIPCSSSFDELKRDRRRTFRRELQRDLEDDDDEEESNTLRGRGAGTDGEDEWVIRSSIGLDSTLDNEEEEDEYDKVASGRESAGERLYMKNVINQDNRTVLAKSFHGTRDPRANHMAAKIRLTEDEAEAQKFSRYGCDAKVRELHRKPYNESGSQLRSILKRKDNKSDSKSHKRVRFVDPGCKTESKEEASQKIQAISVGSSSVNRMIMDDEHVSSQNRFCVPDYVENPCKCTHYSYNASSEVEEKAHAWAGMDFLKLVKGLKSTESGSESENASANLTIPKSVTFIPKKKAGEPKAGNCSCKVKQDEAGDGNLSLQHTILPVGIAAVESQESGARVVEEDGRETNDIIRRDGSQKTTRKYRIRSNTDESDP